ncbi:hypothetical protein [Nonomuraea africana]|uniref:Uncharacterized protein n=1 Tax=Nonomuraea africana TaxID=46171 RepID=A0ABR9K5H0_9ACTN|nr:hypothetical protein [Nonomuraea africana]MBE1557254.1 hypothetical protein [Nonomuraea africana]
MKRRSFSRASGWLAAFVFGLPALGLLAMAIVLRGRAVAFALPYLVLMILAYLVGMAFLAVLRFPPDWLRALVAAVAVYLIALFTPLTTGMASYPIEVVRCGGLPVVATGFAAAMAFDRPGDDTYSVTPLGDTYFCTAKEAEAADYTHYGF